MHDYVLVSLVWVRSDLIIPDMGYASWKMVEMTLELVPASKRLLGSDILQGNTGLPRSWVVPGKHIPWSTHTWSVWAYLSCDQLNEPTIRFGFENVLVVCLGQGPMPSGFKALCRTEWYLKCTTLSSPIKFKHIHISALNLIIPRKIIEFSFYWLMQPCIWIFFFFLEKLFEFKWKTWCITF